MSMPTRFQAGRMPFILAIALSALLLFGLELMAGRLLLPVYGGSPQVWTTALVFFTAVLLFGYAYAHLVAMRLSVRAGVVVQLGLVTLAAVLTAVAPSEPASTRLPDMAEAINVLISLAILVGPAAFLLATTTPLVSAWYSLSGRNPWWLYAISNGASFAGLLAYPFIVQPLVGLSAQRSLLLLGVLSYGALIAWVGASAWNRVADHRRSLADVVDDSRDVPTLRRQLVWLLAAAVPAGLLSATTNFIQTDLVSAPLIWIGPLGVYLASFVVAFSVRGRRIVAWSMLLAPAAAALLWVPFIIPIGWPVIPLLLTVLASLFVLAAAIHGGLYADRPAEHHLTRFYLILAAGGVVGTAAVALVAPLVFPTVYEYPLLVVGALAALAILPRQQLEPSAIEKRMPTLSTLGIRLIPFVVIGLLMTALVALQQPGVAIVVGGLFVVGAVVVGLSTRPGTGALATAVFLALMIGLSSSDPLHRERTFFGVLEVRAYGPQHTFYSGTTVHGLQFLDERRTEPTSYYLPSGPVGDVFEHLRIRTPGGARIGVVGLGAGVLAAYTQPGDELVFIEIDPAVARIAANPDYFTFLADAPVAPQVIIGDGRLELAAMAGDALDVLVIDAFTSDAVPAHLLTAEALAAYFRTLRPGGVLVLNLSNRYYDLASSVASTANSIGLSSLERPWNPTPAEEDRLGALPSLWVAVGNPTHLGHFVDSGWIPPGQGFVLTDDYSDLTRVLLSSGR